MITREEIAHVGKFNKPHGIAGEISATVLIDSSDLRQCKCIVCNVDGIMVPFFIKDLREKSRDSLLLTIEGINSDGEAAMLVNHDIFVLKSEYIHSATNEELPIDFFTNFKVTINGCHNGKIVDIDDSTANVLFVIELDNGQSILVPAVDEFITGIDIDAQHIEMDVPNELLLL
ncbi:MAG: 16S rRNA processing protein RimM [Muribaculaceae bacterium]|nr:16S rRNA processing protein RimM [Muribaculaceae bacterium]